MTKAELGRKLPITSSMEELFPYSNGTSYASNSHRATIDVFVTRHEFGYEVAWDTGDSEFSLVCLPTWEETVAFYVGLCLKYGDAIR